MTPEEIDAQIEKNAAAIRELIVLGRALIETQYTNEMQAAASFRGQSAA